ncbi:Fe-S cluster assembly scaffold protein NifU [Candidatus Poribacteria bacterium]|nr:Fe-S cluster assembly scaffold protein NifU [Candidatus Poribacteria bacterium]
MKSEFQSQYSTKVMEHFMNPQNVGQIENPSGVGDIGNPTCGDIMRLFIKVEDDIITDAKFMTFGCGAAIATSSMVTEMVKGKTIEEALEITNRTVTEALGGLPKVKMHCSVLSEQALKAAINDYYKRQGKPSPIDIPENEHEQCDLSHSDNDEEV